MCIIEFFSKIFKKEQPVQMKDILSIDQLYEINESNLEKCEFYINSLNKLLPEYGIDTPLRVSHFLAQVLHESGHLKYNIENLNYSTKALRSVFGKYFKTDSIAAEYARKPEKIANRVYANRMGNGNEVSGDGWKYRGRGLIQLTGRTNYTTCSEALNIDIINNPDLIIQNADISIMVACWFWNSRDLNRYADKDDVLSITKRINGGTNGLEDRKKILTVSKAVLL